MSKRILAGFAALALAGLAQPASAAETGAAAAARSEPDESAFGSGAPDWIVTLKATSTIQPRFEGAREYGFGVSPGLSIRRPGQPWKFGAPDDGFGFALWDTEWFQLGPVGRVRGERNSSKVNRFRGMHDIDLAIEPGAFIEVYPYENIRVRGELRRGVRGHHGFVGNIAADWIQRVDRTTLSIGPRVEIGDHNFMDEYFGVTAREAARNTRATRYNAKGGVKSVGLAAAATYDWSKNWSTTAFGAYNHLVGEAADSPVAKKLGTKSAFTVGLGVAYSFGVDW
jgi:outer membrane scaffolding protein for murein synthesis (MipA/OmpV family)